jgi:LPXTG-motif cell wall-anchored protein
MLPAVSLLEKGVPVLAQRVVTFVTMTVFGVLALMGPAAADDPNYPPAIGPGGDTAVLGTKVGSNAAQSGTSQGGLPHTGFESTALWLGVAVLLLGIALVFAARRRNSHS